MSRQAAAVRECQSSGCGSVIAGECCARLNGLLGPKAPSRFYFPWAVCRSVGQSGIVWRVLCHRNRIYIHISGYTYFYIDSYVYVHGCVAL